jgi:starch phosphorylase
MSKRTSVPVEAAVRLGGLKPEDVTVEAYYGLLDENRQISCGRPVELQPAHANGDGTYVYAGRVACEDSGKYGLTVRVIPSLKVLTDPFQVRLITWL